MPDYASIEPLRPSCVARQVVKPVKARHSNKCHTDGESVETVRKVHGVRRAEQNKNDKEQINDRADVANSPEPSAVALRNGILIFHG